jgi:hypothetical protein
MNDTKIQVWCVWCGPAALVLYGIAFWGIAGFMPPSSPMTTPEALLAFYVDHLTGIRIGQLLSLVFSTLFLPWFAVISIQIARIEGRAPVLAVCQFGGAMLLMVFFYMCSMLWICAAYRPAAIDPTILRLIHESSWLMFVMVFPEYVLQNLCIAVAGFRDRSADPIFPRWFCWFCLWNAFAGIGGAFAEFVYHGPFAWSGIIGFWIPVTVFTIWISMLATLMTRHLRRQEAAAHV